MLIANPIYDVVFKYLMEDITIAKLLISTIIDEEIESLTLRPQEHTVHLQTNNLTVYRLDFSATIRTKEGKSKQILIELQKAKFSTDIMRFRKYLGKEYSNPENIIEVEKLPNKPSPSKGEGQKKEQTQEKIIVKQAIPLLSIYFLGFALESTTAPVIRVERRYYDVFTGEEIKEKEEFIESLTHDSFVIQISCLKGKRQSQLLRLLSIFDQSQISSDDHHIMTLEEDEFPKEYQEVIRRLQKAAAKFEVREVMDLEDEILEELASKDRMILAQYQKLEEKDQKLEEEKKKVEEEKKKVEEEKKKGEEEKKKGEEKDQRLEEKDEALEQQRKEIEALKKLLDKDV